MTVDELRKRADVYFKSGVKKIYATEDGNFFYEHDKPFADAHSRQTQLKVHEFEPEVKEKAKKAETKKEVKPEVKKETKSTKTDK